MQREGIAALRVALPVVPLSSLSGAVGRSPAKHENVIVEAPGLAAALRICNTQDQHPEERQTDETREPLSRECHRSCRLPEESRPAPRALGEALHFSFGEWMRWSSSAKPTSKDSKRPGAEGLDDRDRCTAADDERGLAHSFSSAVAPALNTGAEVSKLTAGDPL